ncbi:MAG: 50S ribosomal protein L29 [Ignavibacteria bacterium]|nr:50S ribosomal protein L29 [Ignavibacteria bacterium]MBL7992234.1 50S ribosomal protein L29 [Candidatus Kapabacteria bacterium]
MKARKPEDLRKLNDADLAMNLKDSQETLTNLRFKKTLGELENTAYLATLRRDIARINTIIGERQRSK